MLGWSQRVKWAFLSVFGGKIILNVQSHLFAPNPFLLRISLCLPGCWSWANFCFTVGATLTTWELITTGVSHRLWLYLLWAVCWWSRGRQIGYWLIHVVCVWFHWAYSIIFLVKAVDANKQTKKLWDNNESILATISHNQSYHKQKWYKYVWCEFGCFINFIIPVVLQNLFIKAAEWQPNISIYYCYPGILYWIGHHNPMTKT